MINKKIVVGLHDLHFCGVIIYIGEIYLALLLQIKSVRFSFFNLIFFFFINILKNEYF